MKINTDGSYIYGHLVYGGLIIDWHGHFVNVF